MLSFTFRVSDTTRVVLQLASSETNKAVDTKYNII